MPMTNWMGQLKPESRVVKTVQISAAILPGGDFVRYTQDVVLEHLDLKGYGDQRGLLVMLAYCASEEGHECPPRPKGMLPPPQCPDGMDIEPADPDKPGDWSWPEYAHEVARRLVKNLPAIAPVTELIEPAATVDSGYLVCEVAAALLGVGSEDIIDIDKQAASLWLVRYLTDGEGCGCNE